MEQKEIVDKIVKEIANYFKSVNVKTAIIGLSGGIDSALAAKLCILALGKENVICVLMPEIGLSKQENIDDAKEFSESEKIHYLLQPINKILLSYDLNIPINDLAKMNLKARVRANILYSYANTFNALVIGTGNKTEARVGYGTKYGDLACDLFVIGDLYKKEVFALAKYLKLSENIINKIPTAELFEGQTDEQELGISYDELDKQLQSGNLSKEIKERVNNNEHKTKYPFIIKINN
jgi:NAD+ synthase